MRSFIKFLGAVLCLTPMVAVLGWMALTVLFVLPRDVAGNGLVFFINNIWLFSGVLAVGVFLLALEELVITFRAVRRMESVLTYCQSSKHCYDTNPEYVAYISAVRAARSQKMNHL